MKVLYKRYELSCQIVVVVNHFSTNTNIIFGLMLIIIYYFIVFTKVFLFPKQNDTIIRRLCQV